MVAGGGLSQLPLYEIGHLFHDRTPAGSDKTSARPRSVARRIPHCKKKAGPAFGKGGDQCTGATFSSRRRYSGLPFCQPMLSPSKRALKSNSLELGRWSRWRLLRRMARNGGNLAPLRKAS